MADEHIEVPVEVIAALEEVRRGGTHNMFDANGVVEVMYENEHFEAITWLVDTKNDKVKVKHERYMAALHELGQTLNRMKVKNSLQNKIKA